MSPKVFARSTAEVAQLSHVIELPQVDPVIFTLSNFVKMLNKHTVPKKDSDPRPEQHKL
jgi:hypothetical protein